MSSPRHRHHDATVDDAGLGELYDAWHEQRPSRAELADDGTTWSTGPLHEPCGDAECLLCALQRRVGGWVG